MEAPTTGAASNTSTHMTQRVSLDESVRHGAARGVSTSGLKAAEGMRLRVGVRVLRVSQRAAQQDDLAAALAAARLRISCVRLRLPPSRQLRAVPCFLAAAAACFGSRRLLKSCGGQSG